MRSAVVFEPAPLWAVFWAVAGGSGAVLVLLVRIRRALAALRDCGIRVEQWAVRAEERTRLEILGRGGVRRAVRVDGWLDAAVRCPHPECPEGPADGVVLRGRVTNRTETPVWDVVAEIVDPRTGHGLPLIPLTRHVLPPGDEWPLEWICGCTVTSPEPEVIELPADLVVELPPSAPAETPAKPRADSAGDRTDTPENTATPGNPALPVPDVLVEAGTTRPQLRITFSDTTGRWVRQGAWVAPATRDRHLPPGSAALSRASDELRDATAAGRSPDTSRIAIEVGLALHEVARHRLGRFSDSPLDLSALPTLLTRHPLARRLHLEPGTTAPDTPDPGPRPAETNRDLASLALAVRCLDERIGTASGRSPASARLLLAHAGSVLTALNALRLRPAGPARGEPGPEGPTPARGDVRAIQLPSPAEASPRA